MHDPDSNHFFSAQRTYPFSAVPLFGHVILVIFRDSLHGSRHSHFSFRTTKGSRAEEWRMADVLQQQRTSGRTLGPRRRQAPRRQDSSPLLRRSLRRSSLAAPQATCSRTAIRAWATTSRNDTGHGLLPSRGDQGMGYYWGPRPQERLKSLNEQFKTCPELTKLPRRLTKNR